MSLKKIGPELWEVEKEMTRSYKELTWTIPVGFQTDKATFLPDGKYDKAAVWHDYFYQERPDGMKKSQADRIFKHFMKEDGVPIYKRIPIYLGVRLFGGRRWRKYDSK